MSIRKVRPQCKIKVESCKKSEAELGKSSKSEECFYGRNKK